MNNANFNKVAKGIDNVQRAGRNASRSMNNMFPLENIYAAQKAMAHVEKQAMEAQGSFAATGRSFTAAATQVTSGSQRMATAFNGAIHRMQSSGNAGTRAIGNSLNMVNRVVNFEGMVSKFKGAMNSMGSAASAGAKSIKDKLQSGISATDYMAAIFGGAIGNQLFEKAQGKATMLQMLSNKYGKSGSDYMAGYQKYTIASSTPDQQITNLMKYITQSGITSDKTYAALSSIDAAATSADPVQRHELLRNFGQYLTNGYSEALFRGDVTKDEAAKLKAAETPEERIAAMNELAKGRGNVDAFGNNLSTATTGPVAAFNAALVTMDTLTRGMVQGFNSLLVAVKPVFDWFNNLSPSAQNLIGQFAFFTAGLIVLISTIGILYQVMSPVGGALLSLTRFVLGAAMGMNSAAMGTTAFNAAIKASAVAFLTNPITLLVLGLAAAVLYLGFKYDWFTSSLDKANNALAKGKEQIDVTKNAQKTAKEEVDKWTKAVNESTPGTEEHTTATRNLSNAKKNLADKTREAEEAETNYARESGNHKKIMNDYSAALERARKQTIAYKVAIGELTPEQGEALRKQAEWASGLSDADNDVVAATGRLDNYAYTTKKSAESASKLPGPLAGIAGAFQQFDEDLAGAVGNWDKLQVLLMNAPLVFGGLGGLLSTLNLIGENVSKIGNFGGLGGLLSTIQLVTSNLPSLQSAFASFTGFAPFNNVMELARKALMGVYCAIMGCSPGVIPALYSLSGVFNYVVGGLVSAAMGPLNSVKSIFLNVFGLISSYVSSKLTGIKTGFQNMRSSLISSAQAIQNGVWGPISKLWANLKSFWNWLKGGGEGTSVGSTSSARVAGGTKEAALGRSTRSSNSNNYAGFFGGVAGAVFDKTTSATGMNPALFAGPGPQSPEEMLLAQMSNGCSSDNCYAGGWDYSKRWIDTALNSVNAWKMNVQGTDVAINSLNNGNMSTFMTLANALISGTHYQFYYGDKKSNAQALRDRAFNCYDGAQIMIALAHAMGLPAHMAHGKWGNSNIGHVWAVVNGVPMDTTAKQQLGSWSPPPGSVTTGRPVSVASNARARAAGGAGFGGNTDIYVDLSGATIYGIDDLDRHIERGADKAFAKFINPDAATG